MSSPGHVRRILLLAIAGGSAAFISGAGGSTVLLRRWWIKASAKADPKVDSDDFIPLHLLYEKLDLTLYANNEIIDGDEKFIEFDGLTTIFPSQFVPDEVLNSLFKNRGCHTSEFSKEIPVVRVFQPTLQTDKKQRLF